MIRSAMRTILRRQINEVNAQAWQDSELNSYLDFGLQAIAKEIVKIDPGAFPSTPVTVNLVASTSEYATGVADTANLGVMLVERKGTSSTSYARQVRKDLDVVRDANLNGMIVGGTIPLTDLGIYAMSGLNTIVISPTPDTAVTSGLRITYRPVFTFASDSSEQPFPDSLVPAIILSAKIMALGETWAETERAEKRLNEIIADLPFYWSRDDGEPLAWRPAGIVGGSAPPFDQFSYRLR